MIKLTNKLTKEDAIKALENGNQVFSSWMEHCHKVDGRWLVFDHNNNSEWSLITNEELYSQLMADDSETFTICAKKRPNEAHIEVGQWGQCGPMEDPVLLFKFDSWGTHNELGLEFEALRQFEAAGLKFLSWHDTALGDCEFNGEVYQFHIDVITTD